MRNDPEIVERVLALLRQYGWETGSKKLREETEATGDKQKQETLQFFAGWMAAERGAYPEAVQHFEECKQVPTLAAWACFGQAFLAMRRHDYRRAYELLQETEGRPDVVSRASSPGEGAVG